jgi:hypothetical protein
MPADLTELADLLHDSAVLHRFVDFIGEYCKEQERSQTYADSSELFFTYVEDLAEGIKQELATEIKRAKRFPSRVPILRSNIWTLKNYLRLLHALIKPVADAHTLTIPAPLVELASNQLQRTERMSNSRIAVLLTSEFMYFQRPHTDIKEQARIVETFIRNARFPAKLGFIELPYSQGPSFFTNLAIYHEIGHFVYEELSNSNLPHAPTVSLKSAIVRSVKQALGKRSKDPEIFALAARIVESWVQEIFCDLFAIRTIGPAFSFAFIEILGMLGYLSQNATLRFNPTHPAAACRFAEHVNMLRDDSWWDAISNVKANQKKLLEGLANLSPSSYTFYFDEQTVGPKKLVRAFLDMVIPAIRKLVRQITPEVGSAVRRFTQDRGAVEQCLRAGVVPHTTTRGTPDPVSLINAAFCYYLTSLPNLVKRFEEAKDHDKVSVHSLWTKRLEMWTMKAIEDAQMQHTLERLKKTALWSSLKKKSYSG